MKHHVSSARPVVRPIVHAMRAAILGMALVGSSSAVLMSSSAYAQQATSRTYAIPAGPLGTALTAFASASDITLSFGAEQARGLSSEGLKGAYTVDAGLARLLAGSGLEAVHRGGGNYVLQKQPSAAVLPEVKVTASGDPELLPKAYAGGQLARGGRLGMLGNVDIMDAPFSVTAYTSELIRDQQALSLSDVVINDSSVSMGGPWYFDNFFVRGFEVSRTEIGFNGLYGIASTEGVQLEGVERVELLKGPSTLVNGGSPRGTAGGAINLAPKRADDVPLTRLTANYMSDSNLGGAMDIGRRFGENNAVGVRLNASFRDGNSSIDRENQRAANLAVGLDYRGERLRASADFGTSSQKISAAKSNFYVASPTLPDAPSGQTNLWPDWSYQDKDNTFGMARVEYDVSDVLSVGGAFGAAESRRKMNSPFGVLNNTNGDVVFFPSALEEKHKTHSAELNMRLRFSTGSIQHSTVLSATDYESKVSNYQPQTAYFSASNLYSPSSLPEPTGLDFNQPLTPLSETRLRSYAITDTLSAFNERVLLTLGVRHQSIDAKSYAWDTGAFLPPGYKRSEVTPAVGLVVKAADKVSVYANYVEALSQGATAPNTAVNRNEVFEPFVSKQMEIGSKVDWGRYVTTLSAFQIKRPSGYLGTDNVYRVDGEQRNRGLEFQTFGEPARGVRIQGGITWMDAIMTETANGALDGNKARSVPEWSAKLGTEFDIPQASGLTATARMIYNSSVALDAENTAKIPGWVRFDLGARYVTKIANYSTTWRATVVNVFDREYWDTAPDYRVVTYAMPRTFMMSATVDF